jgi:hypothetical protein
MLSARSSGRVCREGTVRGKPWFSHHLSPSRQRHWLLGRCVVAWSATSYRETEIKLRVEHWSTSARTGTRRSSAVWRSTHAVGRIPRSARGAFSCADWTWATTSFSPAEEGFATNRDSGSPAPDWFPILRVVRSSAICKSMWCERRQRAHRDLLEHFCVKWFNRKQLKHALFSWTSARRCSTANDRHLWHFAKPCEPLQLSQFCTDTLCTTEPLFCGLLTAVGATPLEVGSERIRQFRKSLSSLYEGFFLEAPRCSLHFASISEPNFSDIIVTKKGSQLSIWHPRFVRFMSATRTVSFNFFSSTVVLSFPSGRRMIVRRCAWISSFSLSYSSNYVSQAAS